MAILFYPYEEDVEGSSLPAKLELLMAGAERYKAVILETGGEMSADSGKQMSPRQLRHVYNWQELAKVLREIREIPEQNKASKLTKAGYLIKLAEVYEVLRGAKMPKLEAVRLALANEASQLKTAAV